MLFYYNLSHIGVLSVKHLRAFLIVIFTAAGFLAGLVPVQAAGIADLLKGNAIKWNGTVINVDPLKFYYRNNRTRLIWIDKNGLSKKGEELIKVLKDAPSDGLVTKSYLSALPKTPGKLKGTDLIKLELYLSQSFWRFGRDLSAGRTTPSVSEPDIIISRKKADISGWLKLAFRKGPKKVISGLRPQHKQYHMLRKLLSKTKKKSRRARQIIVNMERWRWLPSDLGKKHVLVNQAAFEMYIRQNGKITDRRKVVVGKPFHRTPMFSHAIKYAEFNPTWTVPKSIAGSEFLPKLRRDPGYLKRNNYQVYSSWEKDSDELNPKKVNWRKVKSADFPYRIVQKPGGKNALGKVKFLFPNKFDVYMHDTPAKKLFSKKARAFSHGCIRVEKPLEFAEKLFGRTLNQSKIKKLLATEDTKRVDLRRPVPVHLTYFTVWVGKNGKASYHKDVYGRDKMVGNILFGRV